MSHTEEPWIVRDDGNEYNGAIIDSPAVGKGCYASIATVTQRNKHPVHDGGISQATAEANARRIVACVNACAGMPTEVLEHQAARNMKEASHRHSRGGRTTRIYLSGPMSGLPDLNFPAFNAESARLQTLGFEVVNPADLNPDPATGWHECMRRDLAALLTCDTLALMDGWQKSAGAHLEMHVAHRVGMDIVTAREVA